MVKRARESDSDGETTKTAEYNTVFVDSNLDTHLAMLVSNSDTVSDFKRKMKLEHMQCFPEIGEILIRSLKVKRRANFYHLPDIMLVWSAFQGVKGNWFLSADVSGTSELMKMDVCRGQSTEVNMMQKCLPMPLQDDAGMIPEYKVEKSLGKTNEFRTNCYSEEEKIMKTESRAKKKRKKRHTEDVCNNPSKVALEGISAPAIAEENKLGSIVNPKNLLGSDRSKEEALLENVIPENMMASKVEHELGQDVPIEHSGGVSIRVSDSSGAKMGDVSSKRTEKIQDMTDMEQTAKDDVLKPYTETHTDDKKEDEKDVPIEHSGGVSIRVSDSSGAKTGGVNSKRTKKIQDMTDMEQTAKDDVIKPYTETHTDDKKEDEKDMSLNHDREIIMPSDSKTSDHVDPDLVPKRASSGSQFCDINASVEPEISSRTKKKKKSKKKGKKSADTNTEKLDMEQTDNGGSGSSPLLCPPTDHTLEETHKEENIVYHKEKDVQMTLMDTSTQDVSDTVKTADRNETDFSILTQSEKALDDVVTGDKKIDENTQLSAGNSLAHPPAVEKDNAIVEFTEVQNDIKKPEVENDIKNNEVGNDITNRKLENDIKNNGVDNDIKNPESKNEKSEKKRKKRKPKGSDVQENLAVHVASLQVPSNKSQEKLEEKHGTPVISDDRARSSGNEALGINFKEYFLTGPFEDKADPGNRKVTMSNEEMKASEKVKDNGLPPIGVATESQDSLKSSRNQGSKKKTRVKKDSGRKLGESAQSSSWDEVVPNSSKRSSRASQNGVNDSVPSEICQTTLQKPKEICVAPSSLKEKPSLDKSGSGKSDTFPQKGGNKKSQPGLSVTNKMVMKTPKVKNLLTKPGSIFQVNSGESSGDENGTTHLDVRPGSPSDSSSFSGDSLGKSDLSQDSTRNGSGDAKGRSTGGKSMSKLDLSASKDMTLDMIMRSSKRFKKAKLQASQKEDEDIEFVPDSQPAH